MCRPCEILLVRRPLPRRAYLEDGLLQPQIPTTDCSPLLAKVRPVHSVVKVDVYVPGCPPHAETIYYVVSELLAGRTPDLTTRTRFGA